MNTWPSGQELRAALRQVLHEDAENCRRYGLTAQEWEDRVQGTPAVLAAYSGDHRVLERELNSFSHAVWGFRR